MSRKFLAISLFSIIPIFLGFSYVSADSAACYNACYAEGSQVFVGCCPSPYEDTCFNFYDGMAYGSCGQCLGGLPLEECFVLDACHNSQFTGYCPDGSVIQAPVCYTSHLGNSSACSDVPDGYCICTVYRLGACVSCLADGQPCSALEDCCSEICSSGICGGSACAPSCPDPSTYCADEQIGDGCGGLCPVGASVSCPPSTPFNLSHSGNTLNSITWTWSAPTGVITKYQLFDQNWDLMVDNITTSHCSAGVCSFEEIGLLPNYPYARKVRACNSYGCSGYSNQASAYASIQAVVSVDCTSIGENFIQVTAYSSGGAGFSNLSGGSSGVRFQRTGLDAGYQKTQSYTFSGLTASTNYTFTVGPSRNGDADIAAGTAQITCRTQDILLVPAPPTNLHHTGNTTSAIDWDWNASAGAASYKVYARCQYLDGSPGCIFGDLWHEISAGTLTDTDFQQDEYFYDNVSSQYWSPLRPNSMYGFAVSACNMAGCSGSTIGTAATSIQTPDNLTCPYIYKTSIITKTTTYFSNFSQGSSGLLFSESITGKNSGFISLKQWEATGLEPATSYSFYVKARNQEGDETPNFGPTICSTDPINILYSIRIKGPSSVLKLALIAVNDALTLNRGVIKIRMPNLNDYAAYLVETTNANASPVRVKTPIGIKSWRLAP